MRREKRIAVGAYCHKGAMTNGYLSRASGDKIQANGGNHGRADQCEGINHIIVFYSERKKIYKQNGGDYPPFFLIFFIFYVFCSSQFSDLFHFLKCAEDSLGFDYQDNIESDPGKYGLKCLRHIGGRE